MRVWIAGLSRSAVVAGVAEECGDMAGWEGGYEALGGRREEGLGGWGRVMLVCVSNSCADRV